MNGACLIKVLVITKVKENRLLEWIYSSSMEATENILFSCDILGKWRLTDQENMVGVEGSILPLARTP